MDPSVQASFIPKKPLNDARGGHGGAASLIFIVALLIFIASIVAAAAAFLYSGYLQSSLNSKKASLQKYQDSYDLPTIQALVRFDTRIQQARVILQKHLEPSTIFFFLAQQTLAKVQLTDFSYSIGADGTPSISLSGIADSFSTVALQSDQFGGSKMLKDVIFSDIAVNTDGTVSFKVTADVDPSLILFSKNLTQQTLPPGDAGASSTSTATTTP
ncbi:MAG TPA: PilN domain-containing protein [Candidatus Paceibacterota bacterium]|nr:PilN domain-containing protein [Candidatus Paceibacterota bacterium]